MSASAAEALRAGWSGERMHLTLLRMNLQTSNANDCSSTSTILSRCWCRQDCKPQWDGPLQESQHCRR